MCQQCQDQRDRDAKFWRTVRRALLMVASAIADRYPEDRSNQRVA